MLKWKCLRCYMIKHSDNIELSSLRLDCRIIRSYHQQDLHCLSPFLNISNSQQFYHTTTGRGHPSPALQDYTAMLYKQLATSLSKRTKANLTVAVSW